MTYIEVIWDITKAGTAIKNQTRLTYKLNIK